MKLKAFYTKRTPALLLAALLTTSSCTPQATNVNSNTSANSNSGHTAKGGTPADATPLGKGAPGFFMAGPTGNVSLNFTAPQNGQAIQGNAVAPTFNITGYPIYHDDQRKKGQHIHVILDNEPYEADYDPNTPFSAPNGKFTNLKPGTHTLRAFPSREWHESIKQPDGSAFKFLVFHVGQPTAEKIDVNAPLLTYSRPKGEYRFQDDPRGLLLDFYVTNARLGPNDYKVQYTLDSQPPKQLTRWDPIWFKWEELTPGDHKVVLELVDKDNKPVPFMVNGVNYNRTERTFKILNPGEQPAAANTNSPANANANRSGSH